MKISVIAPVYEQWDLAKQLVKALEDQTLSQDDWEVILVDNGSNLVPVPNELTKQLKNLIILTCPKPGSYAARNKGVSVAKGELLVFVDADCLPKPNWLESYLSVRAESQSGIGLYAGAVSVENVDSYHSNLVEDYDKIVGLPQAWYAKNGWAVTANLAIEKWAMDLVGGFNEERFSGGDNEFCVKAKSLGVKLIYADSALVVHPARKELAELVTKTRRVKGGQIKSGNWGRRLKFAVRAFIPPVRQYYLIAIDKRIPIMRRLQLLLLQTYLWLVGLWELLRLIFGGKPERR